MDKTEGLNPNFTHLEQSVPNYRWTLLQGGTRSGKTYSALQWIIKLCLQCPNEGLEIDIVRVNFKLVKATAWKDMKDILVEYGLYSKSNHNKTDHIYNLNGNLIYYYGADDPNKLHGRSRDIFYGNEINQFNEEDVDQITPRTRLRMIGDYNPAIGTIHWLDRYIAKYPPKITTYKDNPFLTPEQVADIESKKDKPYWWSVYGCGERAKLEGVIFPDFEIGDFDESLPYYYGLDFGYVNDPDACDKIAIDEKKQIIYVDEQFHEHRQSIAELAVKVKQLPKGNIIADSAEQRLINDLSSRANRSITPVKKGAGSVMQGIAIMQNYKIIVTERSVNTIQEFNNYAWSDKGKQMPIDDFNHHIDAIRYVCYTFANNGQPKQQIDDSINSRFNKGIATGHDAAPWESQGSTRTNESIY